MADKKISQLTTATTPLAGTEVLPIVQSNSTVKVPVSDLTAGRVVTSTGLEITGTGGRITGDMSNSTVANRVLFQTSTTNGNTTIAAIPNGTASITALRAYGSSDPANSSLLGVQCQNGITTSILSDKTGTGTYVPLAFYTSGTKQLQIETTGNLTLSTGNLVIGTSGKGIDFSATSEGSGTMTSELLNDYEEGTWTPTYKTDGTNFAAVTMMSNCKYTKVGRLVTVSGYCKTSNMDTTGATGNVYIDGLPFTPGTSAGNAMSSVYEWGTHYPMTMYVDANSTKLWLMYKLNLNGQDVNLQSADMFNGTFANKNQIIFSFSYFV